MKTFVLTIAFALASIATAQASTHTVPVELQGSWCAARTVGPIGSLPNGFDKRVTLYNMTTGTGYDDVQVKATRAQNALRKLLMTAIDVLKAGAPAARRSSFPEQQ
jgi:hypothetical protein